MHEPRVSAGAVTRSKLIRQAAGFAGQYTPEALRAAKEQFSTAIKEASVPHGALSEQLWHLHHQCWKALLDEAYARQRQQKLSAATQRRKNRVANLSQIEMDRQNQQRNRLVLSVLAPQTILVNALNNGRDKSVQQEAKQIRQSVEQELSDLEEASLESANKHRAALSTIQDVLSTLDELGL